MSVIAKRHKLLYNAILSNGHEVDQRNTFTKLLSKFLLKVYNCFVDSLKILSDFGTFAVYL